MGKMHTEACVCMCVYICVCVYVCARARMGHQLRDSVCVYVPKVL